MEETKRPHTSSSVKNRYNKKAYRQVATQVKPELADRIKAYRERKGISLSQFLAQAIELLDSMGDADGFTEPRIIPIYFTLEAVAYPSPTFEIDFEYLETGEAAPAYADFAAKIDGDSMEPYIMDGSTVYVNRDSLADGDVGIFCLDGDMLCKQYHKDAHGVVRLLSLNRERADADRVVSDSSTLACFGRVILPHQIKVVI